MSKQQFPQSFGSARAWKASMRRRLRAALKAIGEARRGCAWNPAYDAHGRISRANNLLQAELESCSAKNWGR